MQSILVVLFLLISGQQVTPPQQSVLHGSVRDEKGAVVWPASVEVTEITDDARPPQNVPSSEEEGLTASAYTDNHGQFRIALPHGYYQVCAGGGQFPRYCQNIHIESGKEATAGFVFTLGPADSEVMDQRLRKLAGTGAIDCGHVLVNSAPQKATTCAMQALRHHKAFYVRYDAAGIDAQLADGIAMDSSRNTYGVIFDSMGLSESSLTKNTYMPDGWHTVVLRCPKPAKLRLMKNGKVSCFRTSIFFWDPGE